LAFWVTSKEKSLPAVSVITFFFSSTFGTTVSTFGAIVSTLTSTIFSIFGSTYTFGFSSSAFFYGTGTFLINYPIKFSIFKLLVFLTGTSSGKITVIATGLCLSFLIFKNGCACSTVPSHLSQ